MKRFLFALFFTLLVAASAVAQEMVFAEGLPDSNHKVSVAHAPKTRTLVYVWERYRHSNKFTDIRMMVVQYSKSGVFTPGEVQVLSGSKKGKSPSVSYNTQSRRFLVIWETDAEAKSTIYGRALSSRGEIDGKAFELFKGGNLPITSGAILPLLKKEHIGKMVGDFLVAGVSQNIYDGGTILCQINTKSGEQLLHNTDSWPLVSPKDIDVTEDGQILLAGIRYPSLVVLVFKLNDSEASLFKVTDSITSVHDFRLTQLSSKLFFSSWNSYNGTRSTDKYRLVRATGKPKGKVKSNVKTSQFSDGNYMIASNGVMYNASLRNEHGGLAINRYSSKGKHKEEGYLPDMYSILHGNIILVEIEALKKFLVFYVSYDESTVDFNGYLHPMED